MNRGDTHLTYAEIGAMTLPQISNATNKGKPPKPGRTTAGDYQTALANHAKAKARVESQLAKSAKGSARV